MKTKIQLVTDLITGLGLTKEEYAELLDFILAQSGLKVSLLNAEVKHELDEIKALFLEKKVAVSAKQEADTKFAEKREESQSADKKEAADKTKKTPAEKSAVKKSKPAKSYYVPTGRKRGRPRKNPIETAAASPALKTTSEQETKANYHEAVDSDLLEAINAFEAVSEVRNKKKEVEKPLDEVKESLSTEAQAAADKISDRSDSGGNETAAAAEEQPKLTRKQVREQALRKVALPGKQDLDNLKMGGILPLNLLYETKEETVLSDRVLNSLVPLGVCVKYKYNGGYFAVSTYDMESMSPREAAEYAKKLPKVNGNSWMVLTPQQRDACKTVREDLNLILKKVGGDAFDGEYVTIPPVYGAKGKQTKVRFAVEL